MSSDVTVWTNPACSKCRTTQGLLADHGVEASYVEYLREAPSRAELERVLALLGSTDPRVLVRTSEPLWAQLGLESASDDAVLDALHDHPILIQRPIVMMGDRAVIARPPERALELLSNGGPAKSTRP